MATTTNYGWTTPDDTALVKDGASAIRSLGTSVDTTTKNLNPSTTLGDIEYRSSTANTNTRLGIGTTGQVLTVAGGVPSWAAPAGGATFVGANVTKTSNQSISNATWTNVTWNNEQFDTNAFHDNSTNNTRLTIPSGKDGKYLITVGVVFDTNGSGVRHGMIKKNNANYYKFNWDDSYSSERKSLNGSTTIDCVATDYIEVEVYQSSGSPLNVTGGGVDDGQFTITYLGA